MKTTRRRFLQTSAAATAAGAASPAAAIDMAVGGANAAPNPAFSAPAAELNGFEIARRHRIEKDLPTPNFFEGMLLGNGDVGVCVTVRPDAIGLHLGKSDSWDIRVSEDHYQYVLPFRELLELWDRASEEAKRQGKPDMTYLESNIDFFREYTEKVAASYGKPWPRPWPCGIVWVHWDPRTVTVRHQVLDPSNGLMTLDLDHDDLRGTRTKLRMLCFVDWESGLVSVATDRPVPVSSVTYEAYSDVEARLPRSEVTASTDQAGGWFTCLQRFPATAPTDAVPNPPASDNDRNFALLARLEGIWAPLPF